MSVCPHCGQPLPETRFGVRLTPLKVRIFDLIRRAGSEGITYAEINAIVFDGRASRHTVKAHVQQIRDLLAGTDVTIHGEQGGATTRDRDGRFRLTTLGRHTPTARLKIGRAA